MSFCETQAGSTGKWKHFCRRRLFFCLSYHLWNSNKPSPHDPRLSARVANAWSYGGDPLIRKTVCKYFTIVRDALLTTEATDPEERRKLESPVLNLRCGTNRTMFPGIATNHLAWFERIGADEQAQVLKRSETDRLDQEGNGSKRVKMRSTAKQDLNAVFTSFVSR